MIDFINWLLSVIAALIIGAAGHSIYLHEKERHGWKFPWDHDEDPPQDPE